MNILDNLQSSNLSERKNISCDFIRKFKKTIPAKRFIFGFNVYSKAILELFHVGAIIDDTRSGEKFRDIPIISFFAFQSLIERDASLKDECAIISAVGGRPLTAIRKLSAIGVDYLDYFNFKHFSELPLPEIPMNEDFQGELERNSKKFQEIYDLLADQLSKSTYLKLLKFRLTYDVNELQGMIDKQSDQYFEKFLGISDNPAFLDVGSFDGFTTLKFIESYPNFMEVIAIEPQKDNFLKCKLLFQNHPKSNQIRVVNAGVGSKSARFRVTGSGSTARLIDSEQVPIRLHDSLIDVLTIDEMNLPKYDRNGNRINWLIKMDIEGMEYDALIGASGTIKQNSPTLAICVYHSPIDMWRIADFVMSISTNYQVYVRHYSESIYETVMFFIPK
jgi:FkbM family methyltransferase